MKFIVDANVGKLAKWLRIAGFDTTFYKDIDDSRLVRIALKEGRILLTRDSGIFERRIVTTGKLKAILVTDENIKSQLSQVVSELSLTELFAPFTRCAECNEPLVSVQKDKVKELIPSYVFKTQTHYMRCPRCDRVYWKGTHWERMQRLLGELAGSV